MAAAQPRIDQPRNYFQISGNVAPGTSDFACDAGVYGLTAEASVWGTLQLRRLVMDGANAQYVPVGAALAANGFAEYHLPAGRYNLIAAGTTTLAAVFERIGPWAGR